MLATKALSLDVMVLAFVSLLLIPKESLSLHSNQLIHMTYVLNKVWFNFCVLSEHFYVLSPNFLILSTNFYDLSTNFLILSTNFYDLSTNFWILSTNF